jgi:protocatechuate 3,4-dioxygenase alpha subunit
MPPATTAQTVGPFFTLGLEWLNRANLMPADRTAPRLTVQGRVLDGEGRAVPDAVLELWQADAEGVYRASDEGFARVPTDGEGRFRFTTVTPGRVAAPDGTRQAPHIVVSLFARGLLVRLVTRMYFPGQAANAEDFALRRVDPARRATLVATAGADATQLEWSVVLQGPGETVFFDC